MNAPLVTGIGIRGGEWGTVMAWDVQHETAIVAWEDGTFEWVRITQIRRASLEQVIEHGRERSEVPA